MSMFLRNFLMFLGFFYISHFSYAKSIIIHYMPFDVETYNAVTIDNIKCSASEKWILPKKITQSDIFIATKNHEKIDFDDQRIRALIVIERNEYYTDSNGIVKNGDKFYKVDISNIEKIGKSLSKKQRKKIVSNRC